jgi:hypothetical protein
MKLKLVLLLAAAPFIFSHCKKNSDQQIIWRADQLAGLWMTFRQTDLDGSNPVDIHPGTTVFGIYNESVVFHIDNTFIPANILNGQVSLDEHEEGTFEYIFSERKLKIAGYAYLEFTITKYDGLELWLSNGLNIFKLKKM